MIDISAATKPVPPGTKYRKRRHSENTSMRISSSRGQALVEFAMVLPLLVLIGLAIVELSFLMHDQHVVIRMSREGSNLISRGTSLDVAGTTMQSMVNPPVDLSGANSKLIFSVITRLNAAGQPNNGYVVLYQRYEVGSLSASSAFTTQGTFATGGSPDYYTVNSSTSANLRITNLPSTLVLNTGQFVFTTEIYTRHSLITSLNKFGINLPSTLYSVAYF
jgi:Flp pilus assembly protein TadG